MEATNNQHKPGHCRQRKMRCEQLTSDPQGRCVNCTAQGRACIYEAVGQDDEQTTRRNSPKPDSSARNPEKSIRSSSRSDASSRPSESIAQRYGISPGISRISPCISTSNPAATGVEDPMMFQQDANFAQSASPPSSMMGAPFPSLYSGNSLPTPIQAYIYSRAEMASGIHQQGQRAHGYPICEGNIHGGMTEPPAFTPGNMTLMATYPPPILTNYPPPSAGITSPGPMNAIRPEHPQMHYSWPPQPPALNDLQPQAPVLGETYIDLPRGRHYITKPFGGRLPEVVYARTPAHDSMAPRSFPDQAHSSARYLNQPQ